MNKVSGFFLATVFSGTLVLLGLATLAARSITPVYDQILQFCGVAVAQCQAIMAMINPASLVAAGILMYFGFVFVWQIVKTIYTVRRISAAGLSQPNSLVKLSDRVGLGGRIRLVAGNFIFCEGLVRPKVVVGLGLLRRFSAKELEAALLHESYHVRNFDPLRVLLASTLSKGLFFVPVIKELARNYLVEKEIAADRFAESVSGSTYLARALYKVLARRNPDAELVPALVPSLGASRTLTLRSGDLAGLSSTSLAISVIAVTVLASLIFHRTLQIGGCS